MGAPVIPNALDGNPTQHVPLAQRAVSPDTVVPAAISSQISRARALASQAVTQAQGLVTRTQQTASSALQTFSWMAKSPTTMRLSAGALTLLTGCDLKPAQIAENISLGQTAITMGGMTALGVLAAALQSHPYALGAAATILIVNLLSSLRGHIKTQDRETATNFLGTSLTPYSNTELTRILGVVQAIAVGAGVGIFETAIHNNVSAGVGVLALLGCIVPAAGSALSSLSAVFGNSMLAEWVVPRLNKRHLEKNGLNTSADNDNWRRHAHHFAAQTEAQTKQNARNFAQYSIEKPLEAARLLDDMLRLALEPRFVNGALSTLIDIMRSAPKEIDLSGIVLKTMPALFDKESGVIDILHKQFFRRTEDSRQRATVLDEYLNMYEDPNHILRRQLKIGKKEFKSKVELMLIKILKSLKPEEAERVLAAFGKAHPKMPADLLQRIVANLPEGLNVEEVQSYMYNHSEVVASIDNSYLKKLTPHGQLKAVRKHIDVAAKCPANQVILNLQKMGVTLRHLDDTISPHFIEIAIEGFAGRVLPNGKKLTANELRAYFYGQREMAGKRSLFDDRNFDIISEPFRARLVPMTLEEGKILKSDLVDPDFLMTENFLNADVLTRLTYLRRIEDLVDQDQNAAEVLRIRAAIEIAKGQTQAEIAERRTASQPSAEPQESILSRARRALGASQKNRQ